MRWERYVYGDTKITKKFALLPIAIGKEVRWLEWVKIKYKYDITFSHFTGCYRDGWEAVVFIDEE